MVIAYVGISVGLFFVARFSPHEWHNPYPCNPDAGVLRNNFNMLNSLWFIIGCLMQKGTLTEALIIYYKILSLHCAFDAEIIKWIRLTIFFGLWNF